MLCIASWPLQDICLSRCTLPSSLQCMNIEQVGIDTNKELRDGYSQVLVVLPKHSPFCRQLPALEMLINRSPTYGAEAATVGLFGRTRS